MIISGNLSGIFFGSSRQSFREAIFEARGWTAACNRRCTSRSRAEFQKLPSGFGRRAPLDFLHLLTNSNFTVIWIWLLSLKRSHRLGRLYTLLCTALPCTRVQPGTGRWLPHPQLGGGHDFPHYCLQGPPAAGGFAHLIDRNLVSVSVFVFVFGSGLHSDTDSLGLRSVPREEKRQDKTPARGRGLAYAHESVLNLIHKRHVFASFFRLKVCQFLSSVLDLTVADGNFKKACRPDRRSGRGCECKSACLRLFSSGLPAFASGEIFAEGRDSIQVLS